MVFFFSTIDSMHWAVERLVETLAEAFTRIGVVLDYLVLSCARYFRCSLFLMKYINTIIKERGDFSFNVFPREIAIIATEPRHNYTRQGILLNHFRKLPARVLDELHVGSVSVVVPCGEGDDLLLTEDKDAVPVPHKVFS